MKANPNNNYAPGVLPEIEERKLRVPVIKPVIRKIVVPGCGHKLDLSNQPDNKCYVCWGKFFVDNLDTTTKHIRQLNSDASVLTAQFGNKYTKMLKQFVEFVKTYKALKGQEELVKKESSGN